MRLLVPPQHGRACEALVAHVACVRLLPGVRAHVPAEVARPSETLPTGRAAVRPLAHVPDSVLYQLPLHVKRLPALIAGEDFVSRVRLFVLLQITEVTEPSTTDVTQVWLFS